MHGSNKKYLIAAAAVFVIALALLAFFFLFQSPDEAKLSPTQRLNEAVTQLDTLIDQPSPKPLVEHLKRLVADENWLGLGAELAVLRHGKETNIRALSYLSKAEESADGSKLYANAVRMGTWVGAVQAALLSSDKSSISNTEKLSRMLSGLNSATDTASAGINYQGDFIAVLDDVSAKNLKLSSAIELIGSVEINDATITEQIDEAIAEALIIGLN